MKYLIAWLFIAAIGWIRVAAGARADGRGEWEK